MKRLLLSLLLLLSLVGCSYWKARNVAIYERRLAAEDKANLPPEPTLEKKRVDDVSSDSILERDGLTPAERKLLNKERKKDIQKRNKRREKIFKFWSPNYGK